MRRRAGNAVRDPFVIHAADYIIIDDFKFIIIGIVFPNQSRNFTNGSFDRFVQLRAIGLIEIFFRDDGIQMRFTVQIVYVPKDVKRGAIAIKRFERFQRLRCRQRIFVIRKISKDMISSALNVKRFQRFFAAEKQLHFLMKRFVKPFLLFRKQTIIIIGISVEGIIFVLFIHLGRGFFAWRTRRFAFLQQAVKRFQYLIATACTKQQRDG